MMGLLPIVWLLEGLASAIVPMHSSHGYGPVLYGGYIIDLGWAHARASLLSGSLHEWCRMAVWCQLLLAGGMYGHSPVTKYYHAFVLPASATMHTSAGSR